MRFKDFVLEADIVKKRSYVHSLEESNPLKTLNEHCTAAKQAIKNGTVFYRGFMNELSYPVCRIKSSERISKDTSNLYQIMMDASPSLKEFPSRSRSIICSTSLEDAYGYGKVHVILPFDGANIAISDEVDFISQRIGFGHTDIKYLDSILSHMLSVLKIRSDTKNKYTDMKRIDHELSKLDFSLNTEESRKLWEKLEVPLYNKDVQRVLELFRNMPKSSMLSSLAEKIMTPSSLGISHFKFGDNHDDSNEVWFEGTALAFYPSAFHDFLYEMKREGYKVDSQLYSLINDHLTH